MSDQAQKLRELVSKLKSVNESSYRAYNRVITITSGKGGVGKTNFTANLAIALSNSGFKVLVLDADMGLADLHLIYGVNATYDLSDVINDFKTMKEIIIEGPNNIKFISGGSGVRELVNLSKEQLERIATQIMELEEVADILLIDTGAGISETISKFALASDEIIVIVTPEPTSMMDAYALIKTLSFENRDIKVSLVTNMVKSSEEGEQVLENFRRLTEVFLRVKVNKLGYILRDESVVNAVKSQEPFLLSSPKSVATKNLLSIASKILNVTGEDTTRRGFIKGFLNRFMKN